MTTATVEAAADMNEILAALKVMLKDVKSCVDCPGPARPICGRPCKNIPAIRGRCDKTFGTITRFVSKGNKTIIQSLRRWYSAR